MLRIFQHLRILRSQRIKFPVIMESSGSNKTEIKDFSILPKTFDFMAYFDEGEPESTTDKSEGGSPHMEAYFEAGADYVISSLDELKELIRLINSRLLFHESMEN